MSSGGTIYGSQVPTFRHCPPYSKTYGDDAIKLASIAGVELLEWQANVVRDWLSVDADGKFTSATNLLLVSRQQGKSLAAEVLALYLLVVRQLPLTLFTLHDYKSAREVARRVEALVSNLVKAGVITKPRILTGNNEQSISITTTDKEGNKKTSRLMFMSRTNSAARGFTVQALILDEAFSLTTDHLASIMPTVSSEPNALVVFTSSAGMDSSEVLEDLRDRGYKREISINDWSANPDDDPTDEAVWARVNPSYGYFLTKATVERELAMPTAITNFQRERLGVWALRQTVEKPPVFDSATIATSWSDSEIVGPVVFSAAGEPDRTMGFIAVAGVDETGTVKVELVETRKRVSWLPERLEELDRVWNPLSVTVDVVGALSSIASELEQSDLSVKTVTTGDALKAQAAFEDALKEGRVKLHYDDFLSNALEHANKRTLTTGSLWDTPNAEALQSPLQAVTLAYWGWLNRNIETKSKKKRTGRYLAFS